MEFTYQQKLRILMAFHFAWAIVLWFSISKYGLGVSTDSVDYLFAGVNLAEGKGLISYDGSLLYLWPPLYPMLIGFVHLFGFNGFVSAHIIQFAAFILIAHFSSDLFLKVLDDFPFVFLAAFLLDTGTVVISSFHMVGPDYLFILFPLVLTVVIGRYSDSQSWIHVILIGLIASLGMLLRYIGYTLVFTGLIAVYQYTKGSAPKRIVRAASVGLFSIPPFLWMAYTWVSAAGQHREPLPLFDYIRQFTAGVLEWITTAPNYPDITSWQLFIVWVPILGSIVLAFMLSREGKIFTAHTTPLLSHGLIYTVFLFVNASIVYFNRLNGRFLLPIYIALVILVLLVISRLRTRSLPAAKIISLFLVVVATLQIQQAVTGLRKSVNGEIPLNFYNTREWNENSALQYWKQNPPTEKYNLLGNYAAGVAFQTDHMTIPSPRRTEIYDTEIIPLSTYVDQIFEPGKVTYLIWVEPNIYEHVYEPQELAPITDIKILYEGKDGSVYKLTRIQ